MSGIVIQGVGAVSPAGWAAADLVRAVNDGVPLPTALLERPGQAKSLVVRRVPAPPAQQAWQRHPRLRRVSPIARHAAAAAIEALGADAARVAAGELRLGIVYCVMAGCVNYSSRFYQEVMVDPATASPLVFPETVFNAPASHLAALLGTTAINYTQVGDDTAFVTGLATAAGWLTESRVDGCLVIGSEETDWLIADAMRLFAREAVLAEGAGAVYLRRGCPGPAVEGITGLHQYIDPVRRRSAVHRVRAELESFGPAGLLVTSTTDNDGRVHAERSVWHDWTAAQMHSRQCLGNAFNAGSAWQVILAAEALRSGSRGRAYAPVTGCNQAAAGVSLSWSAVD